MRFYKQLYKHDPENGVIGDCLRTAWGCLLGLPPEEVPHFTHEAGWNSHDAGERLDEFLGRFGYGRAKFYYAGECDEVLDTIGVLNPAVWHTFSGTSRNNVNHVVLARDGKILHDPSLDGSGIIGPMNNGFYLVEMLVPLEGAVRIQRSDAGTQFDASRT